MGGFKPSRAEINKLIVEVEAATDLTLVANAIPYTGAVFSASQSDAGAYAITLPTAANAAEGAKLVGWHLSVMVAESGSEDITIIRGDASNDSIFGVVVAGDAASSGITISSNVITIVGGTAVEGDRVDITCIGANASNTFYLCQGMCKV